jgi:hypothetical protein
MRPGDVLEGWTLRACLAPGPLARWEAARDEGREGHVLVAGDEQAAEELARMRAALARMRGMGVPALLGHGEGWVAHASPPGEPLTRWIAAGRSVVEVLDVAASLAEVLAAAHAHGCAHGMLGGDDIVVDDDACVTVLGLRAEEGPAAMAEDAWALGALMLGALREVTSLGLSGAGAQEVFAAVRARDARLGGVLVSLLAARPRERATCAQVVGPLRASGRAAGEGMGLAAEPEPVVPAPAAEPPLAAVPDVPSPPEEAVAPVVVEAPGEAREVTSAAEAPVVPVTAPDEAEVPAAPSVPAVPVEADTVEEVTDGGRAAPSPWVPLPVPPAAEASEVDVAPEVAAAPASEEAPFAEDDVNLDLDAWFDAPADADAADGVAVPAPSPVEEAPLATDAPAEPEQAPEETQVVALPPSARSAPESAPVPAAPRTDRSAQDGARRVVAVPRAGTPLIARPHPHPRLDRALDAVALVVLAVHVGLALAVLWLQLT